MISGFLLETVGARGIEVELENAFQVGDLAAGFLGEGRLALRGKNARDACFG